MVYADHHPTKNVTLEVAYITGFAYQQGDFAGLLWETLCRVIHGGWGSCFDNDVYVSKAAMCDVCYEAVYQRHGTFNQTKQKQNFSLGMSWCQLLLVTGDSLITRE
jgi:hypothetical protein